ncbi:MAG: hypothetical protein PHF37_09115 [Phycisphaerae bacterium]|nr:hypothetical protein [Phycisphaerae bacterium]
MKNTISKILVLVLIIAGACAGQQRLRPLAPVTMPLPDGFVFSGTNGTAVKDSNDVWYFKFDSDLISPQGSVKAGQKVQILASSTLEKIVADVNGSDEKDYKIWGQISRFENKNYVFPVYFLLLSKSSVQDANEPNQPQDEQVKPVVNEPNDPLAMPDEILAKMKKRKVIRPQQVRESLKLKNDFMLADQFGLIEKDSAGNWRFFVDGLGWNSREWSVQLLPCEALERAIKKEASQPERLRFNIAGIVTEFEGEKYMLLQRAVVQYGYGNFE